MIKILKTPAVTVIVTTMASSMVNANTSCQNPVLLHQHRNVATIESLELQWTRAYLQGDTEFEECLLTADFVEITRGGGIKHLSDELELAANNKAKPLPIGELPTGSVLLHGNVAVAYGRSQNGAGAHAMRYADFYIWENGRWRVYFAQQTEIVTAP